MNKKKLYARIRELADGIPAAGGVPPDWHWVGLKTTTEEQIIAFGKRLRQIHDIYHFHRQVAALGYKTDDLHWLATADLNQLQTYVEVQRQYLDWCQQHHAAVQKVRAAWAAERARGHFNPEDELVCNLAALDVAELDQFAARIGDRIATNTQASQGGLGNGCAKSLAQEQKGV
jgi:hypothetical protein